MAEKATQSKKDYKALHVLLTKQDWEKLHAISMTSYRSKGELVREAIEEYFKNHSY